MKVPSLRTRLRQESAFEIRPARSGDWLAIEKLLSYAQRHYMALEWWTVQEWLGSATFLLAKDQHGRAVGLMLTVVDDAPIAWLRVASVTSERYLAPLLDASVQHVLEQGGAGIAFLGSEAWMLSQLRQQGFRQVNRVITLRHRGPWFMYQGPPDLQVRSATPADLDAVLALDQVAFAPLWWYSRKVLNRALQTAFCFDVAYLEDHCVGYQLSTLQNRRGHIVRLATHPDWLRRGIGGRLLCTAIKALDDAGAQSVTVNTQEDNEASHQLYGRFSFERVGQPWAVWLKSLK
jgi:ribosomal protein S18 acetylase RimI-like enzyme